MTELTVAPVDAKAARYAVTHWHYSRKMPVGRSLYFGAYENGRFVGVVIFGRGANLDLGTRYGLTGLQVCELTRIALRQHQVPVSQIVPAAVSQLRRTSPGLRLVVSFADPTEGHHGGIYQAMNWLYLGKSAAVKKYRTPTGDLVHHRVTSKDGFTRQFGRPVPAVRRDQCEIIRVPGKHRYVLPLDRAMRRQLIKQAQPYPSREPLA